MYSGTVKQSSPFPAFRCNAQATLEMACALICVFLLFVGALNLFIWFNNRLVLRHLDYEHSRVKAGSVSNETQVDESKYPALNILGK